MTMKKIVILLLTVLLLAGCQSAPNVDTTGPGFQIDFFSVGNADAALVMCEGHYMMIDCGSDEVKESDNSVAYKLDLAFQEKGVTHFDYIICTHPDEDHYEGFLNLLKGNGQTRTYGKFYCSTEVDDNTTTKFREFASSVQTTFKRITVPSVGTKFKLGSAFVEVLAVNSDGRGVTNDSSIVLMISYGDTKFLFTGDAESATESYLVNNKDIKCDVLKVAHHGSSTSTSEEFLYKAKPDYAVISVGYENRYGHPSDKVLTRLENRNIQIFRTDSGTVVCNSDGTTVDIHTRR